MKYNRTIILKNKKQCLIRNCQATDAKAVYDNFNLTHGQTVIMKLKYVLLQMIKLLELLELKLLDIKIKLSIVQNWVSA